MVPGYFVDFIVPSLLIARFLLSRKFQLNEIEVFFGAFIRKNFSRFFLQLPALVPKLEIGSRPLCVRCVYVVCTSHAFFVFRRIREIEVNCTVTRRNVCSKIEFSPDNLLLLFPVIMAYRRKLVNFFCLFLKNSFKRCKNVLLLQ